MKWVFLLLTIVHASMQLRIRKIIEESVISHVYVTQVGAMCDLVASRLAYTGLEFHHQHDCTKANITSKYGTTLTDLYATFGRIDNYPTVIRTTKRDMDRKKVWCLSDCHIRVLLGNTIRGWVNEHSPIISLNTCWKYRRTSGVGCLPVSNVTVGTFEMDDTAVGRCFLCLREYDRMLEQYQQMNTEYIHLEANLYREIALVWRFQMPSIIAAIIKTPVIKF